MTPPATPDPANPHDQGHDLREIRTTLKIMEESRRLSDLKVKIMEEDIKSIRSALAANTGMPNDRFTMGEIAEQGAVQGRQVRAIIHADTVRGISYDDIVRAHERGKDTAGRLGAVWWQIPSAIIIAGAGYLFGLFGGHKP